MSDTPPEYGTGWWQASDGKWYPSAQTGAAGEEFADMEGRSWAADPTRRSPYRAKLRGKWTNMVTDELAPHPTLGFDRVGEQILSEEPQASSLAGTPPPFSGQTTAVRSVPTASAAGQPRATVRTAGFVVLAIAAVLVALFAGPDATGTDISTARLSGAMNLESAESAPQQDAANGFETNDLLEVIAWRSVDDRLLYLLVILVLAVCWHGLTSDPRRRSA